MECMPPRDGRRKLVPPETSHSNPLLEMENLFTAPGEHVGQCRIKTGGKKTYYSSYYSQMTIRGYKRKSSLILMKRAALTQAQSVLTAEENITLKHFQRSGLDAFH